jgi:hypothetical protein
MFGFYGTFPQNVHRIEHFVTPISSRRLQQTLIQLLHELNKKTLRLEDVGTPSVTDCDTVFEFGIAEDNGFNYLDDEETTQALKIIQKSPLQILDFLCAVRYYRIVNETRKPLKFDYYMLRFTFNPKFLELQLFHERGPMRILPEELVDFVIKKINDAFSRRVLKPLKKD